ncbi:MAG TPA: gliding motility protein GldM [Saprospiraceae bacterium]|nr:gliding motility protein GldM [Saprospiraceae bacterium]MCB9270938.1 gliding motility protein GldM [Lewinellaceae bacterium]HRV84559.1 gliding motility protein GldM [Saprospiraceae bacterium]
MSIPKEPRQLMINIMYLVLTALLALNVSAEIFNAFKVVDDGLKKSNSVLDDENAVKPARIDQLSKKKQEEFKIYAERAPQVRALSAEFASYVSAITDYMIDQTGNKDGKVDEGDYVEVQGHTQLRGKKDKDITTRYLVGDKKEPGIGGELKNKILEYRGKFLDLVDEADRAEFENKIALNVDEETWKHAKDKSSWEDYYFRQMPLAATLPIFTKFINDAKSSENAILDYYLEKVGGTEIVFDQFQVVASPKKSYITRGENYEADIFLSAFSKNVENLSVRINGANVPVNNGVASFKSPGSSVGVKKYTATISFTNPVTKEVTTKTQDFEYEVGERSASISLDKMNVFYIGVENPITVAAAGVSTNDLKVSGEGITMKKAGSANWIVEATRPGSASITLSGGGLAPTKFDYRVKMIPDPTPRLGGVKEDEVGNGVFKVQKGLIAALDGFDFDAKCNITGYRMVRVAPRQDPEITVNAGASFSDDATRIRDKAKPGDRFFFENIRCKCPGDAAARKLPNIAISIN